MKKEKETLHQMKKELKTVADQLEKKVYEALSQKQLSFPIEWHNNFTRFMEEIEGIDNIMEMNALIQEGKNLETKLNAALATLGETSMGLEWPSLQ
jgi:hypothetical protein